MIVIISHLVLSDGVEKNPVDAGDDGQQGDENPKLELRWDGFSHFADVVN